MNDSVDTDRLRRLWAMTEVTITVDDDHLASIDEVVAAVRAAGFR